MPDCKANKRRLPLIKTVSHKHWPSCTTASHSLALRQAAEDYAAVLIGGESTKGGSLDVLGSN